MRIGVPREVKVHEYRVGLVPGSVRELVAHGHDVLVETGAGAAIGFPDEAYAADARRVKLEASGNVNLQTIRAIAETGVDYISTSKITMAAPTLDIGLDVVVR